MANLFCDKNEHSKHYGNVNCGVCQKDFDWLEDENAEVIVDKIQVDNHVEVLVLSVIAKCPSCNYKVNYFQKIGK